MIVDWMLVGTVGAPVVGAFFGVWLNQRFESRPRLIVYYGHVSEFDLQPQGNNNPPPKVHTHSIVVRNVGKRSAKNVRVGHLTLPTNFKVFPITEHSVNTLAGGGQEIVFPNMVPKKQITISYLYFPPLTWNQINAYVESDEGAAKITEVLPTPPMAKWLQRVLWSLIIIGTISLLYLIIEVTKWGLSISATSNGT